MSNTMELNESTLETIGTYVKSKLPEWLSEVGPAALVPSSYGKELVDRQLRVEDELQTHRLTMERGFARMDEGFRLVHKRLEDQRHETLTRFEQIDRRIDQVREEMLARFEEVDKRFDQVDRRFEQVDKRFEQVDKRFELTDKRIDQQREKMLRNFDQAEKRMIEMSRHFSRILGAMTVILGAVGTAVALVIAFVP